MRRDQRHRRRRLVDLAALDPDRAVLDHVDPPDPVGARLPVQLGDQLGERERLAVERDRQPGLEADHDLDRLRRGVRIGRQQVRLLGRRLPGSSRTPASIERPNRFSSNENGELCVTRDRDAVFERVLDLLVARPDRVAERRDHRHAGVVRAERELEAELVVALAGAAVDGRLGAELLRQLGDRPGDHRAGERRDERVLALVERVRLQRLRALLVRERLAAIDEQDVVGAGRVAALLRLLEVELLADVAEHGDDLVVAVELLQPGDDAGGVEPAPVGEHGGLARSCCSFQEVSAQLLAQGRRPDAGGRHDEDRVLARHRGEHGGGWTRRSRPRARPRSRAA